MARVKKALVKRRRHKRILKEASGYWGSKHLLFRTAKEQVMRSGNFAFAGRKQKHRKSRELSIIRLNAAVRKNGISYSSFINRLKEEKIDLNRSILVKIASNYYQSFLKIINIVKNK